MQQPVQVLFPREVPKTLSFSGFFVVNHARNGLVSLPRSIKSLGAFFINL